MADKQLVLTEAGLLTLAEELLKTMATSVNGKIVQTVDSDSDAKHIPSAVSVYNAVKNATTILSLVVPENNTIEDTSVDRDPKVLYLVRKSATDTQAVPYVYIEGTGFIKVCAAAEGPAESEFDALDEETIKNAVAHAATQVPEL